MMLDAFAELAERLYSKDLSGQGNGTPDAQVKIPREVFKDAKSYPLLFPAGLLPRFKSRLSIMYLTSYVASVIIQA